MKQEDIDEIKRHFDVVAERLESKISVVAEGVAALDSRMDREVGALRLETREGFAEIKAMIKFSYAELDRRISALETSLANLEARVIRLEAN